MGGARSAIFSWTPPSTGRGERDEILLEDRGREEGAGGAGGLTILSFVKLLFLLILGVFINVHLRRHAETDALACLYVLSTHSDYFLCTSTIYDTIYDARYHTVYDTIYDTVHNEVRRTIRYDVRHDMFLNLFLRFLCAVFSPSLPPLPQRLPPLLLPSSHWSPNKKQRIRSSSSPSRRRLPASLGSVLLLFLRYSLFLLVVTVSTCQVVNGNGQEHI